MEKEILFLLLLVSIVFGSCNDTAKKSTVLDTDFPVTKKLEFKPSGELAIGVFDEYSVAGSGICVIDGSVLWYVEDGKEDCGACYDLRSGKKLAVIARKGSAENEINELTGFKVTGDAVMLYEGRNTIKTFAKKDILDNIPVEERKVTVVTAPGNLLVSRMAQFPDGSVIATIRPPFEFEKGKMDEINNKSVAVFDNDEVKAYETIKYDNFDVKKATDKQIDAHDLIKWTYAQGLIETKGNDMAVFAVSDQFILYTLDLNSGEVNEKVYSFIRRTEEEMSFATTNDMILSVQAMKANDKYIVCKVEGYLSEEDKEIESRKEAIFVFDWNLKPIKKFELPEPEEKLGYYTISNDCSSVYFCEYHEEGITLYKADLSI